MKRILHAPCSLVNRMWQPALHAAGMSGTDVDDTWERIRARIAELPHGAGREATWLADRLQMKVQRVHNWKTRGVPAAALVDIAAAIGWSVNQVLGLADPPAAWPFETIEPERLARLTPRQAALIELTVLNELERIERLGKRDGTNG